VHVALIHSGLLAGITWDPFIRGLLIVTVAVLLLPGSVYLVLSTDTGARLGLLLTAAGLSGLLSILAVLWLALSSTAAIGRPNSWKPLAVVTGDYPSQVTSKSAQDFPASNPDPLPPAKPPLPTKHWYWPLQSCSDSGWRHIDPAKLTDVESASDKVLVPSSAATPGAATPTFGPALTSPFSATTDYAYVDAYDKGANSGCLFAINRHKIYLPFARSPHLVAVRAQPALPQPSTVTTPLKPDRSKPYTYIILERNLGSVRQPQMVVAISMGLVFLIICNALHRRDKEIMARQAAEKEAAAGGPGGSGSGDEASREPVGAST
jgi:hypothetical protein